MIRKLKNKFFRRGFHNKDMEVTKNRYFLEKISVDVKNFQVVFDVGAFEGEFTHEVITRNPKVTVHCFEPSKDTFRILKERFSTNSNIQTLHAAVSDISGVGILNLNSFSETNSLLESADVSPEINLFTKNLSCETVDVITLDEYCDHEGIQKIDFLKIDIQGNSFKALMGLERMLKQNKIHYCYVEAEFIEIYKNEKLFSEIEILMRAYNYHIVDFYNLNYVDGKLAWCDVLFQVKSFL